MESNRSVSKVSIEGKCRCTGCHNLETHSELISHLLIPDDHTLFLSDGNEPGFQLTIKFLTRISLKIFVSLTRDSKVSDLKTCLQKIFGINEASQVLYHQSITLNDAHSLVSCRIKQGSEVAIAGQWDHQLYQNNAKFMYKHIEGYKVLMFPHAKEISHELHRLLTVLSSNQIDIMQIRGDIKLIQSIALLGAASECFYVDHEAVPEEIFNGAFSISKFTKSQGIPDSDNLRIALLCDGESLDYYFSQLDLTKDLVFIAENLVSDSIISNYVMLNWKLGNFTLLKPKPLFSPYEILQTYKNNLKRIHEVKREKQEKLREFRDRLLSYTGIYVVSKEKELDSPRSPINLGLMDPMNDEMPESTFFEESKDREFSEIDQKSEQCIRLIFSALNSKIDSLHLLYMKMNKKGMLEIIFDLTFLALARYSIEVLMYKDRPKSEFLQFFDSDHLEKILLQIEHNFKNSCVVVTFLSDFYRTNSNLDFISFTLNLYQGSSSVNERVIREMRDSYRTITQNTDVLANIVMLDVPGSIQSIRQSISTLFEEIRQKECNELINLLPNMVFLLPSILPISGKTLLGGGIAISETVVLMQHIFPKGACKMIYTLRHEIAHKKWLFNVSNNHFTAGSPFESPDRNNFRESGIFLDQIIYGNSNPRALPNFTEANEEIETVIIRGQMLSDEQRIKFYKPRPAEPLNQEPLTQELKYMKNIRRYYSGEILCQGRWNLYSFD